jgi:ketosteroid isomerase-like protein
MSPAESKTIVQRFIQACNGTAADPWQFLSTTPVISVNGSTWFSGRFEGHDQIRRILLDTAQQYLFSARAKIVDLIGEGEQIAALVEISGATRDGTRFDVAGAAWGVYFALSDGRISEIGVFPDTMFLELVLCGGRYAANNPMQELA